METVHIELAPDLAALLPGRPRSGPVSCTRRLPAPTSLKDALEALGLPHVEIGAVSVGGEPASLDTLVFDGAAIVAHAVRPAPLDDSRFLCDTHLGKLARLLRIMGFDTVDVAAPSEPAVARQAITEDRVLLSRGRAVLKRREIPRGMLVLPDRVDDQAAAVVRRFDLADRIQPYSRCARCNGPVVLVDRSAVEHRIPPRTARWLDTYYRCERCDQLYWEGTHVERLRARIATITRRAGHDTPPAKGS